MLKFIQNHPLKPCKIEVCQGASDDVADSFVGSPSGRGATGDALTILQLLFLKSFSYFINCVLKLVLFQTLTIFLETDSM